MNKTSEYCIGCDSLEIVSGGGNCKLETKCDKHKKTKYVRCFYCDIRVNIDQIEIRDREKDDETIDTCDWTCPVCNTIQNSYIFKGE